MIKIDNNLTLTMGIYRKYIFNDVSCELNK